MRGGHRVLVLQRDLQRHRAGRRGRRKHVQRRRGRGRGRSQREIPAQEVGRVPSRLPSGFLRDSEPEEQQQHRHQQHVPELEDNEFNENIHAIRY